MQGELNKAASDGYRILASSPTSGSEIVMLMEKAEQPTEGRDYKLLATSLFKTLEKELNEAATEGFRLLRQAVAFKHGPRGRSSFFGISPSEIASLGSAGDETVAVMEKAPGSQRRYEYRFVVFPGAGDSPAVQKKVSTAVGEGFQFAAMVGEYESKRPGKFGVIILEKEVPTSPTRSAPGAGLR